MEEKILMQVTEKLQYFSFKLNQSSEPDDLTN